MQKKLPRVKLLSQGLAENNYVSDGKIYAASHLVQWCKEKKYPVKVSIDIGKVTISCTNQTGDAKEEMYVSTEGQNLEAGFNPKYFLDALRAIEDEEIFVNFGTSISPCIIRPVDDGDYTYMILPIRLKD